MTTAQIELPPKLVPVFDGVADVRGSYGGRGSAKTRTFAKMTAVRAYVWDKAGREGIILCGRQFMNSLAESSLEEIKAAIASEPWLADHFEVGDKYIKTRSGRISYAFTGLDRNIASIKSKARILLAWVDEAEEVTDEGWIVLIPTIREEDAELWITWNPKRKNSATHKRFRIATDPLFKIAEMNWRNNPWFPDILERARLRDLKDRPDQYDHIWEGDFVTVVEGAYYASSLTAAKAAGRIGRVSPDPLMIHRLYADIGGTGAKADAFVFWDSQFVGREIRALNYYEAVGQPIGHHLGWLRENKLEPSNSKIFLPHDGDTNEKIIDWSYRRAFEDAGYPVEVIPNQGKGAAKLRIEAARRVFPSIWFNEATTETGRDHLGWYHEKKHPDFGHGLGPEHDGSSHAADAFGLMCVAYEAPQERKKPKPVVHQAGGWMG